MTWVQALREQLYLRRMIVQEEEDGATMMVVIGMMLAKVFMFKGPVALTSQNCMRLCMYSNLYALPQTKMNATIFT